MPTITTVTESLPIPVLSPLPQPLPLPLFYLYPHTYLPLPHHNIPQSSFQCLHVSLAEPAAVSNWTCEEDVGRAGLRG